jgi:hypothetical protein
MKNRLIWSTLAEETQNFLFMLLAQWSQHPSEKQKQVLEYEKCCFNDLICIALSLRRALNYANKFSQAQLSFM